MYDLQSKISMVEKMIAVGQFNKAVPIVYQLLEQAPEHKYLLTIAAHDKFCKGKFDDATKILESIINIEANDVYANRHLAIIKYLNREYQAAIALQLHLFETARDYEDQYFDILLMGISISEDNQSLGAKVIEWVFIRSEYLKNAYLDKAAIELVSKASIRANTIARNERFLTQKESSAKLFDNNDSTQSSRFLDFLMHFHGLKTLSSNHELQKPTYHLYPGLRSQAYYNTDEFIELEHFENNFNEIRKELLALYTKKLNITPYIQAQKTGNKGLDLLTDSYDWSAIHLYKGGECLENITNQCPATKAWLSAMPLPNMLGHTPEAFLSILKPKTIIKPHFGLSNLKVTVHIALSIPNSCSIKVAGEQRHWCEGEILIFDDSFIHEASNNSDEVRIVFITEFWHPDLSDSERKAIELIMKLQSDVAKNAQETTLEQLLGEIKQYSK